MLTILTGAGTGVLLILGNVDDTRLLGVAAGLVLLGALVNQVLAPLARVIHRAGQLLDVLEALEKWMPGMEKRVETVESEVTAMNRELGIPARGRSTPRGRPAA